MSIITLLTDNGQIDHYVAAIKAKIISIHPSAILVDISHNVYQFDRGYGAFLLKSVFRDFPERTVHLIGIDSAGNQDDLFIAIKLENHFFVGVDNGFFGLISEMEPQHIISLNSINSTVTTFPERDILAPAAAMLASGADINSLGLRIDSYRKLIYPSIRQTKNTILGSVLHVDYFGNLITNISKESFYRLGNERTYKIQFGGKKFDRIHDQYYRNELGGIFLIFNSLELLEIGMYKSNASELLGLNRDSPVIITFEDRAIEIDSIAK